MTVTAFVWTFILRKKAATLQVPFSEVSSQIRLTLKVL
jgi:hypothetical protein